MGSALPAISTRMAKAAILAPQQTDWKPAIGGAIERCRLLVGLTLKEFAATLPAPEGAAERDERQIARWIAGTERPQLDVIFAVEQFRGPLVIALAELSQTVDVQTTLVIRRRA